MPRLLVSFYIDSSRPVGVLTDAVEKALAKSKLPEIRFRDQIQGVILSLAEEDGEKQEVPRG